MVSWINSKSKDAAANALEMFAAGGKAGIMGFSLVFVGASFFSEHSLTDGSNLDDFRSIKVFAAAGA